MKKTITVFLVLMCMLLTAGCTDKTEDKELAVCGSYAVPGMFCHDLKGGSFSCEVLERDEQGRILFAYRAQSVITGQKETAYVICQNLGSKYVSFYEDVGYIMQSDQTGNLETLKALNDWNKPVNQDRISKRKYSISVDMYIVVDSGLDFKEVKTACCETLGIQATDIILLTNLDVNQTGQELYWLTVKENEKQVSYYILANTDYQISFAQANRSPREVVPELKQSSGWIYG